MTSSSSRWTNVPAVDHLEIHSPGHTQESGVMTIGNTQTEYISGSMTITYPVSTAAETHAFVIDVGSSETWSRVQPASKIKPIQLFYALQELRESLNNWDVNEGPAPTQKIIGLAEQVVAVLPVELSGPRMGIGSDGDIYFSWEKPHGVAFLTIDEAHMHVLIKGTDQPPVYHDNLPQDQAILANRILPSVRFLPTKTGRVG